VFDVQSTRSLNDGEQVRIVLIFRHLESIFTVADATGARQEPLRGPFFGADAPIWGPIDSYLFVMI